jgi:hypothetical protein
MGKVLTTLAQPFLPWFSGSRRTVVRVVPEAMVGVLVMRAYSPFGPQALKVTGWPRLPRAGAVVTLPVTEVPSTDVVRDRAVSGDSPKSGISQCGARAAGLGRR